MLGHIGLSFPDNLQLLVGLEQMSLTKTLPQALVCYRLEKAD